MGEQRKQTQASIARLRGEDAKELDYDALNSLQRTLAMAQHKIMSSFPTCNPPDRFIGPISQTVMEDPVIASDKNTYERARILEWFNAHDTSPLTNEPLQDKLVKANEHLKSEIEQYKQYK